MDALKNLLRIITVLLLLTGTFDTSGSRPPGTEAEFTIAEPATVEIIVSDSRIDDRLKIRLVVRNAGSTDTRIEVAKCE